MLGRRLSDRDRAVPAAPLEAWPERRRRSVRTLPQTVRAAVALIRRADGSRLWIVVALQLGAALLLAAQVLLGNEALQTVIDADRGRTTVGNAVVPLVALAASGALASLAAPLLLQQQRLLGELVHRAVYGEVLDVTESVDLALFETSDFFDRLQRVQANAVLRPLVVTQGLVQLVGGIAGTAAIVVALLALEPLLVPLLLAGGLPLLVLGQRGSAIEFAFAVEQTPASRLRQYLGGLLTGREQAKELRAYHAAGFLRRQYDALWARYLTDLRHLVRRRLTLALLTTAVVTIASAGTMVVLLLLVVNGRIALAEAGAAAIAVRLLAGRLELTFAALGRLFESALFLDDLREFLVLRPDVSPARAPQDGEGFDVLEAQDLRYRYPSAEQDVLHGVNVVLRAGEVVAIVGENGSGKSTLIKLLAGLYAPTGGRLTWNGTDMASIDPDLIRRSTSVVFQDFIRYALPARDNISLGHRDELDDVMESARVAHAHPAIARLPRGYGTVLSAEFAGGTDLSGGQWQRVALARALHRDATLVLLDEPTAALDPRAEQRLFETVRGVLADKAVVLVSHRFSTVRSADRILVMAEGRIVEQGSHEELMDLGGIYADLYSLQASGYRTTQ